jgi:hypothetical protein
MQNLQDQIDQIRSDVKSLTEAVANLRSFCYEMGNAAPVMDGPIVIQDEAHQVIDSDEVIEVQSPVPKLEKRPAMAITSSAVLMPDQQQPARMNFSAVRPIKDS